MADLNKQALEMWNAMKPMVDREIDQQTKGAVQRRKAKVTTAPSLVTKKIGVTEPFGDQYFIPYDAKVAGAKVGDVVWVEYMYGASNAFASMFAKAVEDPRSCSATMSSAGWHRVLQTGDPNGSYSAIIDIKITRNYVYSNNEAHCIRFIKVYQHAHFVDETSKSNALIIDKIRYITDADHGYVDVHYAASSTNTLFVDFDVATSSEGKQLIVSETLQSVADAPAGETVVTTYDFTDNVPFVGSNANGEYRKYPDGTLICIKTKNFGNIQSNGWTAWGAWYETTAEYDAGDWAMPFIDVPSLSATQVQYASNIGVAVAELWTDRTTLKIGKTYFYRPNASDVYNVTYNFVGIGRWK